MIVELHLIQNFAPSCLNRDDTNSPKDCDFGGYRRARLSSQCLKRAIRRAFPQMLPPEDLAWRTRRLALEIRDRLAAQGKDADTALALARNALGSLKLVVKDGDLTQYLVFVGSREIEALSAFCLQYGEALQSLPTDQETEEASGKGKRGKKKGAGGELPKEALAALQNILDGGKAVDLALFGRMLADLPERNIDAACQVAHALSTHEVGVDFDFYTAVDDLSPREETGAGMMGTVEFISACFYRYANLDFDQLTKNLGGDQELARKSVAAFLRAAVTALPTGKQNSMAAHNPPSLVFGVVRHRGCWSLANAFVEPIRPKPGRDLIQGSVAALEDYWQRLCTVYGADDIPVQKVLALDGRLTTLAEHQVDTLEDFINGILDTLPGGAA